MAGYRPGLESNHLKDFSVSIEGIKLSNGQIFKIKIKWDIKFFRIIGELVFSDETSLVEELPIRGGETVVLSMTDFDDDVSKQTMKVASVSYRRAQNAGIITHLELIDNESLEAIKLYPHKGFVEASMVEIIDNECTMKPILTVKEKDFCCPPTKHKEFVVPRNMSFNKVCDWLVEHNNYYFFQDRDKYYIKPLDKLFAQGPLYTDKFIYKPNNIAYRYSVYDWDATMGKAVDSNYLLANSTMATFDLNNKHKKYTPGCYSGHNEKLGSPGVTAPDYGTSQEKEYYISDFSAVGEQDYMFSKNMHKEVELEVLVPGKFKTNVGQIIEIDFINVFDMKSPEKNITGKWLITECVDVIVVPDFVQRLTLSRAKFST